MQQLLKHYVAPPQFPPATITFITFPLIDSIPVQALLQLKQEQNRTQATITTQYTGAEQFHHLYQLVRHQFERLDILLDQGIAGGPQWLIEPAIAQIVSDALTEFNGRYYRMFGYCIMPNHVHLIIERSSAVPMYQYSLARLIKRFKGQTGRLANEVLNRSGPFWHLDHYEYPIYRAGEAERMLTYTQHNPVHAGLVSDPREWPYRFDIAEEWREW
ncbi:transposase [uncultured Chloroflexus sp.]|uniref:transposase n=1 Tax=uncultured Chloroflexus sp. TaxID=214040 RepID=UPI002615ED28|nr:transposase [uncultured Chloroflexus sp.]